MQKAIKPTESELKEPTEYYGRKERHGTGKYMMNISETAISAIPRPLNLFLQIMFKNWSLPRDSSENTSFCCLP